MQFLIFAFVSAFRLRQSTASCVHFVFFFLLFLLFAHGKVQLLTFACVSTSRLIVDFEGLRPTNINIISIPERCLTRHLTALYTLFAISILSSYFFSIIVAHYCKSDEMDPALLALLYPKEYLEANRSQQLLNVAIAFGVLEVVIILLFLYSRLKCQTGFGLEAYLMLLGFLFVFSHVVMDVSKYFSTLDHFQTVLVVLSPIRNI